MEASDRNLTVNNEFWYSQCTVSAKYCALIFGKYAHSLLPSSLFFSDLLPDVLLSVSTVPWPKKPNTIEVVFLVMLSYKTDGFVYCFQERCQSSRNPTSTSRSWTWVWGMTGGCVSCSEHWSPQTAPAKRQKTLWYVPCFFNQILLSFRPGLSV